MKVFITVFLWLFMYSCNSATSVNQVKINLSSDTLKTSDINVSDFKILKGQLGPVTIGMTIQEAEENMKGFTIMETDAIYYGFGPGGPAYMFFLNDEKMFTVIPAYNSNTIRFIIVVNEKFKTINGLTTNSTAGELLQQYPSLMLYRNLMNDWEVFSDEENNWDFIFHFKNSNKVGEYPPPDLDAETPSKPINLNAKIDWIIMK